MPILLNPSRHPASGGAQPTLVQAKAASLIGQDMASISAVFDDTPIENNLLVCVCVQRVLSPAFTLAKPSGFTQALLLNTNWASTDSDLLIFYKVAGASESKNITVSLGNDGGSAQHPVALYIEEWANMATSTPLDVTASNDETGSTGLVADTGTTAGTAEATSMVIAVCNFGDSDFDAIVSGDFTNSFTLEKEFSLTGTLGADVTIGIAHKILSATGTQNTTLTVAGGPAEERWSGIAVFKGA